MISRKYTISDSSRIEIIKRTGKKIYSPFLKVSFLPNEINHQRFAAIVSSKFSKLAVYRNYVKRAILEGARKTLLKDRFGADIVFFAIRSNAKKDYKEIIFECEMLLNKVRILFDKINLPAKPSINKAIKPVEKKYIPRRLANKRRKYRELFEV